MAWLKGEKMQRVVVRNLKIEVLDLMRNNGLMDGSIAYSVLMGNDKVCPDLLKGLKNLSIIMDEKESNGKNPFIYVIIPEDLPEEITHVNIGWYSFAFKKDKMVPFWVETIEVQQIREKIMEMFLERKTCFQKAKMIYKDLLTYYKNKVRGTEHVFFEDDFFNPFASDDFCIIEEEVVVVPRFAQEGVHQQMEFWQTGTYIEEVSPNKWVNTYSIDTSLLEDFCLTEGEISERELILKLILWSEHAEEYVSGDLDLYFGYINTMAERHLLLRTMEAKEREIEHERNRWRCIREYYNKMSFGDRILYVFGLKKYKESEMKF